MERECVKQAASVEEAVDAALEELGVQQDSVEYEVLEEPGKKMFGIGSGQQAKVRVWVKSEVLDELSRRDEPSGENPEEDSLPAELQEIEPEGLTDEELDHVADTAVATLRQILQCFGIEDPTIEEYEGDEGEIILDVVGGDYGLLIGRHGKTLDALQTAVGAITTHKGGFRYPVVVDVEGYRHRRRQKIEDIARRAADRAARQHTAVRLRPMTAYERRVVHVALRGDTRIVTGSEGADPFRQVVISPK
jgi:spoIIIJ-associated protein